MSWSPDIEFSDIILTIVFFFVMACWFLVLIGKSKVRGSGEDWFKRTIDYLKLEQYENTFILNNSLNNLTEENLLIYTSGEFIYVINKINQSFKKIHKMDILKVDLDIYTTEKNVKRLIALTSTYDSRVNIDGLELKIITKTETNSILMISGGKNVDKVAFFNREKLIDDANRCKLILEDDIKKLNRLKI